MRLLLLVTLTVTMLGGCASAADCGPDWRSIGERDGRMNAGSQAERYAARCGVPVDSAAYAEGYRTGDLQRPLVGGD